MGLGQTAIHLRMVLAVEEREGNGGEVHDLPIPQSVSVDALPDGACGLQADQALSRIAWGHVGSVWSVCEVRRH